jgi:hypothetical protein
MPAAAWLEKGFTVVPGPFDSGELDALSSIYDRAVATGGPDDVRHGSTTTRVNLPAGEPGFEPIYTHAPLLMAAASLIGARFKLSAFHARTLKPHTPADRLHQDFAPLSDGWPMIGFILAIDEFGADNGATRFLPGSQTLASLDPAPEPMAPQPACGPAGAMILFNGSVWHGHGANLTASPRRSIQGALIRWDQTCAVEHASPLSAEVRAGLSPTARALLGCGDDAESLALPLASQRG